MTTYPAPENFTDAPPVVRAIASVLLSMGIVLRRTGSNRDAHASATMAQCEEAARRLRLEYDAGLNGESARRKFHGCTVVALFDRYDSFVEASSTEVSIFWPA